MTNSSKNTSSFVWDFFLTLTIFFLFIPTFTARRLIGTAGSIMAGQIRRLGEKELA